MLQPNLGGVVSYLSASERARAGEARRISAQSESEYAVETDFWKRMRAAILRDRKGMRDGSEVEAAANEASAKKIASFAVAARAWPEVAVRWIGASYIKPPSGIVTLGGLSVSVNPLFSEQWPDGRVEHVAMWMNKKEPTEAAARAVLQFISRLDPSTTSTAVFVDLRRKRTWAMKAADTDGRDAWLSRSCEQFVADAEAG